MRESSERTEAIRQRDPHVLQAVARECIPGLLRAARAAGLTSDEAEDVVQSTFLVFLRRAEEFDGRARCMTWLYGILVRKISEARREGRWEEAVDDIDQAMEGRFAPDGRWTRPPTQADRELDLAELRRHLSGCLEGLPMRQRLAFTLREVDGLSTGEICNILDVTPNNLGVVLYRARNRLRECLEASGISGKSDADVP